jgi:hypothetical protein
VVVVKVKEIITVWGRRPRQLAAEQETARFPLGFDIPLRQRQTNME